MRSPYDVMAEVLDCLCQTVAFTTRGTPCFCGMLPGNSPFPLDGCLCGDGGETCGTAWVRLDTAYPSTRFPLNDTAATTCQGAMAFRIHVGVVRCAPGPDDDGTPPDAAAQSMAVGTLTEDMTAAYDAVACCWAKNHRGDQWFLGNWTNLGAPDGLCVGGYWPFTWWSL